MGAVVIATALAACGGDDDDSAPATTTTAEAPPAAAAAPPTADLTVSLDPEQTGTSDSPAPVRIAVDLKITAADPDDTPTVRGVDLTIPEGVDFRAEELEACSVETLEADGPSGCPQAARIGTGTITARAGTIEVEGEATAIYGGDDRIALWVSIANPVSVGAAIVGQLEEQSDGGYRMALQVPEDLQNVAGLPVALDRLRFSLGRGGALATTGCPDGGLPFAAQLDVGGDAPVEATATADCR